MTRRIGTLGSMRGTRLGAGLFGAALVALAAAQVGGAKPPTPAPGPPATGIVDFQTKVGSFKILSPSGDVKALGKVNMSFQGTVLVVGLEGSVTPGPGVKTQYDDVQHGRKAYFGRGTLAIEGKWRAIQFFGRDFKGVWNGMGVMRLYGEFDDQLQTGTYVVRGHDIEQWGNGGRTVVLPLPEERARVKPRIEDVKPGTKSPG